MNPRGAHSTQARAKTGFGDVLMGLRPETRVADGFTVPSADLPTESKLSRSQKNQASPAPGPLGIGTSGIHVGLVRSTLPGIPKGSQVASGY